MGVTCIFIEEDFEFGPVTNKKAEFCDLLFPACVQPHRLPHRNPLSRHAACHRHWAAAEWKNNTQQSAG